MKRKNGSLFPRMVDRYVRYSLFKQLLIAAGITFVFFMLIWLVWSIAAFGSGLYFHLHAPKEHDLAIYDMFAYAANPPYRSDVHNPMQQIGVIILYLLGGTLISGFIITSMVNWMDRRKERWLKGEIQYNRRKDFTLIIGGHKMVPQLCKNIYSPDKKIVIQTRRIAELLRKDIQSLIGEQEANDIMIYSGDRTSAEDLKLLFPQFAEEIYIVGEDHRLDGNDHDAYSMECLRLINNAVNDPSQNDGTPRRVKCHVMFEYQSSTKIFQYTDLSLAQNLVFLPFNLYEKWAEQVLVKRRVPNVVAWTNKHSLVDNHLRETTSIEYLPLTGARSSEFQEGDTRVHLIVVGMSKMGTMLAAQAALLCHFGNFFKNVAHPRTLITFVDRNAGREMAFFRGRNPSLFQLARWRFVDSRHYMDDSLNPKGRIYQEAFDGVDPLNGKGFDSEYIDAGITPNVMDVDWEFIEGDIANSALQQYLRDAAADDKSVTTIAVCLPVTFESLSASMFLPEEVYTNPNVIQVLVQQDATDAVISAAANELLAENFRVVKDGAYATIQANKYTKLRAFGMLDHCSYFSKGEQWLPKVLHYIYDRTYDCFYDSATWERRSDAGIQKKMNELAEFLIKATQNPDSDEAKTIEKKFKEIDNKDGKSQLAQKWSNVYNINSLSAKALVYSELTARGDKPLVLSTEDEHNDKELIEILAKVEHNRWIMEQMIVGFRPKHAHEPRAYGNGEKYNKDADKWKRMKDRDDYKLRRIHPDIKAFEACPGDKGLDMTTQDYDRSMSMMTPVLIHIYRLLTSEKEKE